jgi:hypothetical protein
MAQSSSNAAGLSRGFRTWSFYRRRPRSAARATPRAGWDEATNGFVGSGNHTLSWIANILVTLVALLHVYFRVPEMFLWTKPLGLRTFWLSLEKATDSAVLAANQGLYKGFLAAGLFWDRFTPRHPSRSRSRRFSWFA